MRKLVMTIGLCAALAGCNKGATTEESARKTGDIRLENASADEVIKQAAAAQDKNRMQPGEWENSVQLVSVEMPGAPEALRKQMEAEVKKPPETRKECRKAEDASGLDFTKLAPAAKGCAFPKYVVADGKIEADMVCEGPTGSAKITIRGSQSATSYDVTMTQSLPGQGAENKMTVRTTGKRIGDCKG